MGKGQPKDSIPSHLRSPAEDVIPVLQSVPLVGQPFPPRVQRCLELGRLLLARVDEGAPAVDLLTVGAAGDHHAGHVSHDVARLSKLHHLRIERDFAVGGPVSREYGCISTPFVETNVQNLKYLCLNKYESKKLPVVTGQIGRVLI